MKKSTEMSYTQYKFKLLEKKQQILNQLYSLKAEFNLIDKNSGDESDQSVAHQEEHSFLITQSRCKYQLLEIEHALDKIEKGTYGICEETNELIGEPRLKALPWTRLSIEGAEIRQRNSAHNNFYRMY